CVGTMPNEANSAEMAVGSLRESREDEQTKPFLPDWHSVERREAGEPANEPMGLGMGGGDEARTDETKPMGSLREVDGARRRLAARPFRKLAGLTGNRDGVQRDRVRWRAA